MAAREHEIDDIPIIQLVPRRAPPQRQVLTAEERKAKDAARKRKQREAAAAERKANERRGELRGGAHGSGPTPGASKSARTARRVASAAAAPLLSQSPNTRAVALASMLERPGISELKPAGILDKKDAGKEEVVCRTLVQGAAQMLEGHVGGRTHSAQEGRAKLLRSMASEDLRDKGLLSATARILFPERGDTGAARKLIAAAVNNRVRLDAGEVDTTASIIVRATRSDKLNEATIAAIKAHWLSADVTRPHPDKRAAVALYTGAVQNKKRVYTYHPRHILEMSQSAAYVLFKSRHPDIKVAQRRFEEFKPFNVKPTRECDRQGQASNINDWLINHFNDSLCW